MLRIALTGGIACGKSTVGALLRKHGVAVCEADQLAHARMQPGRSAHAAIRNAFGDEVLHPDGTVNRPLLGRRVFADPAARECLNGILHPVVRQDWEDWLAQQAAAGSELAVVIVPLLYEAGMESGWDAVVCVRTPADEQMARLRSRGLSHEEAQQRIAAQLPVDEKARLAGQVIENDGTVAELERRTLDVLRRVRESKHG